MRSLYWAVLLTAIVLLASLTSLLRNAQSCACEQTYMYTSYTEIPMLDPRWSKHRYKLLLYRETAYAAQALPPSGRPALLIPGNAGSFEQVRSLASESARIAVRARKAGASIPDLDWYTLDLNSELSAFDGQLLKDQAEFTTACLAQLTAMYSTETPQHSSNSHNTDSRSSNSKSRSSSSRQSYMDLSKLPYNFRPQLESLASAGSSSSNNSRCSRSGQGILLVGHSMGGVVARAAAAAAWQHPDLGPGSISLLLTLASPHRSAPLLLQPAMARFYDSTAATAAKGLHLAGLPMVSIHGGAADMQVSPYVTRLPFSSSSSSSSVQLSVPSLSIPGVWLHAGHTQIDWCNQLASRVAAVLLEVHVGQQQQQQQEQQQQHGVRALQQQGQQQKQQKATQEQRQLLQNEECLPAVGDIGLCVSLNASSSNASATSSNGDAGNSSSSILEAFVVDRRAVARPLTTAAGFWYRYTLQQQQQQQCPRLSLGRMQQQQQGGLQGLVDVGVMHHRSLRAAAAAVPAELGEPVFINAPPPAAAQAVVDADRSVELLSAAATSHQLARALSAADADPAATAAAAAAAVANAERVSLVLQQFLTSRVLRALSGDAGQAIRYPDSSLIRDQPDLDRSAAAAAGRAAGAAESKSMVSQHQITARHQAQSDQHEQRQGPPFRKHSRPEHMSKPSAAAAPVHARSSEGSRTAAVKPPLLLLPTAPLDVHLHAAGACPQSKAANSSSSLSPEWFVQEHDAHQQNISSQQTTLQVTAAAAAAAAAVGDKGGGIVYFWDVPPPAAAATAAAAAAEKEFVVLVSGAKPCSGFRIWLQQQQQQHSGSTAAAAAGSGAWVDVTALSAPLPVLQDELVYHVRQYGRWMDIMDGKDYLAHAAWTLALNPWKVQQQYANITRIAIWWAAAAAAGLQSSSSSSSGMQQDFLPPSATLTAQWQPMQQQQQQHLTSSSGRRLALHLGPLALLRPVMRPAGGALLLELQLHWRWLISGLSVRLHRSENHSSSSSSSSSDDGSSRPCWQPVAVYASSWGTEHVAVFNTTAAGSSSSGTGGILASLQQQWLQPWLRAGTKASSRPGTTAASSSSLSLTDVISGGSVTVLLDPGCEYAISLGWDLIDVSAQILLANASAAAGMAVALLLLVLSHQLSALQRIVAAAVPDGSALSAADGNAAAAAPLGLVFDESPSSSNSGEDDDHKKSIVTSSSTAAAAAGSSMVRSSSSRRWSSAIASAVAENSSDSSSSSTAVRLWTFIKHLFGRGCIADIALHKLRKQFQATLGGGYEPVDQQVAAAAAAAVDPASSSSSGGCTGISVIESLFAVTSDPRVLLAAVLLAAAAAAGLDALQPDHIHHNNMYDDVTDGSSSSSSSAMHAAARWLLQGFMRLLGLKQRIDSPGVFGTVLLLGVALLLLLLAAAASVGVKWYLDWCAAAITAFNRSFVPDPATLAAIAAASDDGSGQQQHGVAGNACSCASFAAADAVCEGPCAAAAAAGGFFGLTSLCGMTLQKDHPNDLDSAHTASAAAAAAGSSNDDSSSGKAPTSEIMNRANGASTTAAAYQTAAAGAAWWMQRKCQVQAVGLLLLAAVNVTLALGVAVLLLFFTWHLPSRKVSTADRQLQESLVLGRKGSSKLDSLVRDLAVDLPQAAADAAAAADVSRETELVAVYAAASDVPNAAAAAAVSDDNARGLYRSSTAGWGWKWGFRQSQPGNASTPAAAAAGSSLGTQQQRRRSDVRSDAGLLIADSAESDHDHDHHHDVGVDLRRSLISDLGGIRRSDEDHEDHHDLDHTTMHHDTAAAAAVGESLHDSHLVSYRLGSSVGGSDDAVIISRSRNQKQQQQQQQQPGESNSPLRSGTHRGSRSSHGGSAAAALDLEQQQQQQVSVSDKGGALLPMLVGSASFQQRQQYYQQRLSIGGMPLLQQRQQQMMDAAVDPHSAAAAAVGASAMHQLSCHVCHAWTLLYGCCFLMLLPSLVAWLRMPLGQQHWSHSVDVLLLLPLLLHCVAMAAGSVDAVVGIQRSPAAATLPRLGRSQAAAAAAVVAGSQTSRQPHIWSKAYATSQYNADFSSAGNAGPAAAAVQGYNHSYQPPDVHKVLIRFSAAYMFAAALLGQAVWWGRVVPVISCLMLAGRSADVAWCRIWCWVANVSYKRSADPQGPKQKGI